VDAADRELKACAARPRLGLALLGCSSINASKELIACPGGHWRTVVASVSAVEIEDRGIESPPWCKVFGMY
jgi:hypothetical protein